MEKSEKRVKYLVCDSGAFIRSAPVQDYAENVYTVKGAVVEIKDKATLQRLQFLPYTLHVKEPSPEACKYVAEFSKKTGDYGSLSVVDLQIIALTYQLEKENVGIQHLNSEPICQVTGTPIFSDHKITGFYVPKEKNKEVDTEGTTECKTKTSVNSYKDEEDTSRYENEDKHENNEGESVHKDDNNESEDELEDNVDEDEGWITPGNIAQVQKDMGGLCLDDTVTTACITTDFCIQNVLIQMGLNVISVDGMLIKQTRVFILRCYSCFKTTSNIEKKFCANCGNKTLKRVAVTVQDDGSRNIHINFRKPLPIRGKRFNLPFPKGGKHSTDPIVCEDQPTPQNRLGRKAAQKIDIMSEDYVALSSPFKLNDVYSKAAHLGLRKINKQNRQNPNEWSKRTGNKK